MKILCRMFGHKPPVYAPRGWWSPGEQYAHFKYHENSLGVVSIARADGTGRLHANVYSECPRCGEEFMLCRIHPPILDSHGDLVQKEKK